MRIDEPIKALKRLDDGTAMRGVFYLLLSLTAIFLIIDVRNMETSPKLSTPDPAYQIPFLPPAGTKGDPSDAAQSPSSPAEVLNKPMTLELGPGGVLLVEGTFDPGASLRFAREIEVRGEYVRTVALNSPGGSVDDALAISKLIREKSLTTKVVSRALCASSCPIVLAGGVERLAEKDAVVGVHQLFNVSNVIPAADEVMSTTQSATARVARHLEAMGIAAELWFNALETPADRLYYLTAKEMADFRLTTTPASSSRKRS
ncbi:ATP-dependent Clp protease proteolytic subunit [Ensifer sp. ENS04]|jgi:hypothetical protein|uniref:ATP-dependent Clp protease proteolytic subunit n=1 Tax=Ensifer TaxID=106591 RepID=UPI00095CB94A|nr:MULTISPECIES: ATP-dependent Clp protease proteolytic subunit [Ensifer]MBD9544594.1 ATP-dependent Clp protease proteolytic subunit [Ensifer sp. ENS04]OKP64768.1 hypothetical protein BTE77_34205 [Ensifer adhaerens]